MNIKKYLLMSIIMFSGLFGLAKSSRAACPGADCTVVTCICADEIARGATCRQATGTDLGAFAETYYGSSDGDSIYLQAGSYNWTSGFYADWTQIKNVSVIGAGMGQTVNIPRQSRGL